MSRAPPPGYNTVVGANPGFAHNGDYPPQQQASAPPPGQAMPVPPKAVYNSPPGQGPPAGFSGPPPPIQGQAYTYSGPPAAVHGQPYGYNGSPQPPKGNAAGYVNPPVRQGINTTGYRSVSEDQAMSAQDDQLDGMQFNTGSFSDKAIRRTFIRKVYLILMTQLLVTAAFVCIFLFVEPIHNYVRSSGGSWLYYVSYATFLVTYIVLICVPSVRRKHPGNFICLGVFTLAFSYMVGTIASYYTTGSVVIAAGITALVCLSITLFAIQTKIDFTMCSGLLFALMMVLIFFGFACMIVYFTVGYNRILDCVWGGLAALVFSLFLVYDTQMLVGGKKHQLSPEEYIYGALQLYMDVVYLFLIILSLFGKSN